MCLSSSTNTSEISRIIAIICFLIYSICTSQQQCNALLSPNKQVASCQAQETHLLHVSLNRKPTILGRRKQAGRRKRCLYLHDDNDLSIRGGDLPSNALPKRRTLLRNVAGALIIGLPLLGEAYSRRIFDWKKDNLDKQFLNDPKKVDVKISFVC